MEFWQLLLLFLSLIANVFCVINIVGLVMRLRDYEGLKETMIKSIAIIAHKTDVDLIESFIGLERIKNENTK